MIYDKLIVGGGVFGNTLAAFFASRGETVKVIDAKLDHSGLRAAGCLIKPSWISKVPNRTACLDLLGDLFGIKTVPFTVINKRATVDDCYVVNKAALEGVSCHVGYVSGYSNQAVWGAFPEEFEFSGKQTIVCRGGWGEFQKPKWGVSFEFGGNTDPVIRPWRPFTQLVKFNQRSNLIWAGDGTAVNTWSKDRTKSCANRVTGFVGKADAIPFVGMRPYVKTSTPAQVLFHNDGVVEVTGGAKNGCIGAAWAALELGKII